jgi:SAM-dependent methyltransferase
MAEISERTAGYWDGRAAEHHSVMYWTEYPVVRSYVNECMTGVWWAYPTHGFKAAWAYKPLPRGLSLGCGTGNLERDLRWLRICDEVDAYDLSPEAIRIARARAEREGIDRVAFHVADCEKVTYTPNHYDAVFFHGSLHHMLDPDSLLDRLLPSLRAGGLLYVDDYVGPSRSEWTQEHLQFAEEAYVGLPAAWRRLPHVAIPYDSTDPSEMVRSSRIIPAVRERFEILYERPYWGNLLYPVLCHVDDREVRKPESEPILRALIDHEKELTRARSFRTPLFAWIVGQKKR